MMHGQGAAGFEATFLRRHDIGSTRRHLQDMMSNDRVPVTSDQQPQSARAGDASLQRRWVRVR